MNCKEFRHQLLTDPYGDDAPFLEHVHLCPECTHAAKQALGFEQKLRAALTAELASTACREPGRLDSTRSPSALRRAIGARG